MDGFTENTSFVETRAFKAVMDKLEKNRVVVIIGRPGDGKTTLAYQALNVLQQKDGFLPIITDLSSLDALSDVASGAKLSLFFDDLCGIYTVEKDVQSKLQSKPFILQLLGLVGRGNNLIIAMRKDIFRESQIKASIDFFKKNNIVDLTTTEFSLLRDEKQLFLEQIPGVNESQIKDILGHETIDSLQIGFPQCVEFMKDHGTFNYETIIQTPIRFLKEKLCLLQNWCPEKLSSLVIAFANNGQICVTEMRELRKILPDELNASIISTQQLKDSVIATTETYFSYLGAEGKHAISHESIMDAIASILWNDLHFQEWYVNHCPVRFLCRLNKHVEDDFYVPNIPSVMAGLYSRLHDLLETKRQDSYSTVGGLNLWDDEITVNEFIQHMYRLDKGYLSCATTDGQSLVVYAASQGKKHLVRALLPHSTNQKQIHSALCSAAESAHSDTVEVFFPQHKNMVDTKVIFKAIKGGNITLYQVVTRDKNEVNFKTKEVSEILHFYSGRETVNVNIIEEICLSGNLELLKHVLMSHNTDISKVIQSNPCLLEYAAYSGSLELVQYMLNNGAKKCSHLVWWAASSGSYEMMKYLLDMHCDLTESKTLSCGTMLDLHHDNWNEAVGACYSGNIELVRYLFETKPDLLNADTTTKVTAVHLSAFSGSLEILNFLETLTDISVTDQDNRTVLHYACEEGEDRFVKYIVNRYPDMLTIRDKTGKSPFLRTGFSGSVELVKYLMSRGCDVYDKDSSGGTVLHNACEEGKLELVQYLLDNYPNMLTITDKTGQSPFLLSGFSGSVELVKYLISRGCDVYDKGSSGRTVLHHACSYGKLELVQYLVDNYPDMLTIRDEEGQSPFLQTGFSGSVEVVKYLMSRGCDVYDKGSSGRTVLHNACNKGKLELVQYLVDNHPDMLTIRDKTGQSPFILTGFSGSVELVKYLISRGCDVYDKDSSGRTVLHHACQEGKLELVQYLVDNYSEMLTIRYKTGISPFLQTGFSGSVELVKYLISRGCDVYDKDSSGRTVLHHACDKGKLELVQYLVDNHPDMLTIRDKTGQSPFILTGFSGSVELVKYLKSRGCDVYDKGNDGWTVLHNACDKGKLELVQYLVDNYSEMLTIRDKTGISPFLQTGFSGSVQLVKYLMSRGCDVYDKDSSGRTVLHKACGKGKLELVQYLVDNHPDMLTIRDKTGQSPFILTGFSGSVELVKYLKSRGCDVYDKGNDGWTVLHTACDKGKLELVQYLVDNYSEMLTIRDKTGISPFLQTGFSGSVELVKYLISRGCDVYEKNNNGWNVLHIACQRGYLEQVQYLAENFPDLLKGRNNRRQTPLKLAISSSSMNVVEYLRLNADRIRERENQCSVQ